MTGSSEPLRIAFLASRIRVEEKLLLEELARRDVDVLRVDDDELVLEVGKRPFECDVAFARSISYGRTVATLQVLEALGIRCVNSLSVVTTCGDKLATHAALTRAGVPMPRATVAFSEESALRAIEEIGYPAVLKPIVGSWGRLVSRVNDRHAAEALVEHRLVLGSYQHHVFYVQQLIEKPGRDIRAFVVGDQTIGAIYRTSEHWITNTARGAKASNCPVEGAIGELALAAARAVGGGIIAVDMVEDLHGSLYVLEVNHTTEFRNSIATTGVDIPARLVDFVMAQAREAQCARGDMAERAA